MSRVSGREVDGSVEGGEMMVSTAGVFGGRGSSTISSTGVGTGNCIGCSSGWTVRVMVRRARADLDVVVVLFSESFFSSLPEADERCFFGETTGSVLTGSAQLVKMHLKELPTTYCCSR